MDNEKRKQLARWALATFRLNHPDYFNHPEEPDEQAIIDLMANLMHLAKEMGQNPAHLVQTAANHYEEEGV